MKWVGNNGGGSWRGRSRELGCWARSEHHFRGLCSLGGRRLSGSCTSTGAVREAAHPAAQPWLGLGSPLPFQNQLVLISKVTSRHCQAAGLWGGFRAGLGWRTAGSFYPVPTLFLWPNQLPVNAGRPVGVWPLTNNDHYFAQLVYGIWGLSCWSWRKGLPAPLVLPGTSHSKERVWAKEKLQASQKPHHCLAQAGPPRVQPSA